jgi:magnesium transporter
VRSLVLCQNGQFHKHFSPHEISDHLANPKNIIWLDIADPDAEDAQVLREEFGAHPLAVEDAFSDNHRPKIDIYPEHYFLIFYAAQIAPEGEQIELQAINMLVGKNYLVSVHRGPIRQIDETLARWQSPTSPIKNKVGALLYALLDAIVDDYLPLMDSVAERTDDLEDQIFTKFSDDSIQTIFGLKRELLSLRRMIAPQRDVINVLLRREIAIFSREETIYLQDVYDHLVRVVESIESYRDLLSSALDSFLSVQSNKLNQVVKLLTIASIILMSNALIAGIYGMNFARMPELQWQYGYPFALGLMLLVSLGLLLFFKRIKWL